MRIALDLFKGFFITGTSIALELIPKLLKFSDFL